MPGVARVIFKTLWKSKKFEEKNLFFSQFGPAVWPAIVYIQKYTYERSELNYYFS